ncbi:MAG: hypothetical protein NC089_00350 [Bacteroides sp.]|nr:hypothetical protein [Bacteroides sp.]MCM1549337.1 hypothetical protein [Clostridium sp.]
MPEKAYLENRNGKPVYADDSTIKDINGPFYCCTEGCNAKMILVGGGTGHAYFRSKDIKEHTSSSCIKCSIRFNSDNYDEERFDLNFAFESMLGLNHSIKDVQRGNSGANNTEVGKKRKIRIHTLPALYSMCISKNKTDYYKGIQIDDILVDNENYEKYKNGINGYKIVEVSKYHKVENEFAFIMNYPADNRGLESWVKISFKNAKLFWKHYNNLKTSNHIEPIVIAGNWISCPNNKDYQSECQITSKNQNYYVKES